MKMQLMKRKLAVMLAVMLLVPTQPVIAANADFVLQPANEQKDFESVHSPGDAGEADINSKNEDIETDQDDDDDDVMEEELDNDLSNLPDEDSEEDLDEASPSEALDREPQEQIIFNTGNAEFCVVNYEDFVEYEQGDAYFEEDGSYTINIPEENPFFPYEVQFTCDGEVTNEWFMSPDDTVEIDGHTFYVSAYFDGTVVTQMSFEVAGDTVMVYPEEKEFTNDGGMAMLSLLPLEERRLSLDLSSYTPVELTMVSVSSIFTGTDQLQSDDKVVWTYGSNGDEYVISSPGDKLDLSQRTCYGSGTWQMIVGDDDQLAGDNIRYFVRVKVTESSDWLTPTACYRDADGNRISVRIIEDETEYYDYNADNRRLWMYLSSKDWKQNVKPYLTLNVNSDVFPSTSYDGLEAYEGTFYRYEDITGENITDQILGADMNQAGTGFEMVNRWQEITLVSYDSSGHVTGCLPVRLYLGYLGNHMDHILYTADGKIPFDLSDEDSMDECNIVTYELQAEYAVDDTYFLQMEYIVDGYSDSRQVTAAYIGTHESIAEAKASGAEEITDKLFQAGSGGGYAADYSKGVYVTVFVGEDGNPEQEIHCYCFKTEGKKVSLSNDTFVGFYGLKDKTGSSVPCYVVDAEEDSYAQYNYLTTLVDETVNLSALAPEFTVRNGMRLYTAGANSPEVSGKSFHDFSGGAVQYSVSAENGTDSKNYWLQIVPALSGTGQIYINSLADADADTDVKGGVISSTREILLDGMHDYEHDILLVNMGTEALANLSVELNCDAVELDRYWTLGGVYDLAGFAGTGPNDTWNQAKLRLIPKDGMADGRDVSGTLTIKSGDTPLMVLTLTGVVGDPGITMAEIPNAVKYVHFGTMIQNNNKYDFNTVSYRVISGSLPDGITLKANGELYGVPRETGDFGESDADFTLTVIENTDENVDNATDENYDLKERVPDITLSNTADHTMTSIGEFSEWENLYLDGVMLTEGVDYTAESGSTRLTIRSQTLKAGNEVGTHTLSAEFRTPESKVMKRAAQNYKVSAAGSGSSGSGGGSSGGSSTSNSMIRDSKKGYMNNQRGIITGNGTGYSHWEQDENGWKLIYADGTTACGYMAEHPEGTKAEQVSWEKVNGSWYPFGTNGYLKSGWIYDYQLGSWYCVSVENGIRSGWYHDPQDGYTYYLDTMSGKITVGWKQIEEKWYYFNEDTPQPTWNYNEKTGSWVYNVLSKNKPYGSMYCNEMTPDGYNVKADGAWDGKEK